MAHAHIFGKATALQYVLAHREAISAMQHDALIFIDPHGHDTDQLVQFVPMARHRDVLIFDPTRYQMSWNPLQSDNIPRTADAHMNAMRITFGFADGNTARMDGVLYNSIAALMEAGEGLLGMYLILVRPKYRKYVLERVSNPVVKEYWELFDKLTPREKNERIESTLNKVQILTADPRFLSFMGSHSTFSLKDYTDDKILFLRLPQGELGVGKSKLLGSIFLAQIHQECLRRDTTKPLHIIINDAHLFASATIADLLTLGQYNVHVAVVHQSLDQLKPDLLAALKTNAIPYVFCCSLEDAQRVPKMKPGDVQAFELPPDRYVVFEGLGYQYHEATYPEGGNPKVSKKIHSHMLAQFHDPATKEVDAMLERF